MEEYKRKIVEILETVDNVRILEIIYNCIVNVTK